MEEGQNTNPTPQEQPVIPASPVSFPNVPREQQKSGGAKTFLIVGILILIAILGFVVYKSATKPSVESAVATPFDNLTTPSDQNIPAPAQTSSPVAVDKSSIAIVVQNGTGIAGEAAYLSTQLNNLGYSDVKTANASSQDATDTTVTFSNSLAASVVTEITTTLRSIYQSVTVSTSAAPTSDVVIVTGLRKGATPKPVETPAETPTDTSSPSDTTSPSPT